MTGVAVILADETLEAVTLAKDHKCMKPSALNADKSAKCHLGRLATNQCIAQIVLVKGKVVNPEDLKVEILADQGLETETDKCFPQFVINAGKNARFLFSQLLENLFFATNVLTEAVKLVIEAVIEVARQKVTS
jgi:hypothetical protein